MVVALLISVVEGLMVGDFRPWEWGVKEESGRLRSLFVTLGENVIARSCDAGYAVALPWGDLT